MSGALFKPAILPAHIHMAWCGPDVVVLDVASDAYALLVDVAEGLRPGPHASALHVHPDLLADLEALDLVVSTATVKPGTRPPLPALNGEIAYSGGPLGAARVTGAALDSLISTADFQGKSFADLVASASRRRRNEGPRDPHRVAAAAAAFQAVHPWIPFEGDCLQRGYMLHHHMSRSGIPANWVFGVRTWPFLAHCWVQVGDVVVGDSRERVQGFTPIMAV